MGRNMFPRWKIYRFLRRMTRYESRPNGRPQYRRWSDQISKDRQAEGRSNPATYVFALLSLILGVTIDVFLM